MSLMQSLSFLAVERIAGGAVGDEFGSRLVPALRRHMADHSQKLPVALKRACRNAWKSLELALAGDSMGERLRSLLASGDRRAFAQQVRAFLQSCPLPEGAPGNDGFREACLREIRVADRRGLLDGPFDADALARRVSEFSGFSSPTELSQARHQAIDEVAAGLRETGLVNLARLVGLHRGEQPSLLVLGVHFFFRREVECDEELARGLTFSHLEGLDQAQESGFAAIAELLSSQGEKLEHLLADLHALSGETYAEVLDIHTELRQQGGQLGQLYEVVLELRERLRVGQQAVSPRDCHSVSNESDLRRIRDVKTRYWSLPDEQRRQAPALGNAMGGLSMAAGDYAEAEKAFALAADAAADGQAQAVAHLNAYLAALQQGHWETALGQFRKAVSRGGRSVAPFPVDRYRPERILGAGGFGVAFLCRHTRTEAQVVVKAIQGERPDRDVPSIFREAMALEQLEHPGIIRVRDCDYADAEAYSRPYLVMDYFEGRTLSEQVRNHGPLALPDFLQVAGQVASALAAAHAGGILHRDVKPANILLRKLGERWQVKLIDFGLAFRLRSVQETVNRPQGLQNTLLGQSIAGTIDYAAPEQMGKLSGVGVSQASDVYGFGKTCCYALFGTPNPGRRQWKQLEDGTLCELLDDCLSEQPVDRPAGFPAVLERLGVEGTFSQIRPAARAATATPSGEQERGVPQLAANDLHARPLKGEASVPTFGPEKSRMVQPDGSRSGEEVAPSVPVFTLRSGTTIRNLDDLLGACHTHWDDVAWHVMNGSLARWLEEAGHEELAGKAENARTSGSLRKQPLIRILENRGASFVARLESGDPALAGLHAAPAQGQQPSPAPPAKKALAESGGVPVPPVVPPAAPTKDNDIVKAQCDKVGWWVTAATPLVIGVAVCTGFINSAVAIGMLIMWLLAGLLIKKAVSSILYAACADG